MFVSGDIALEGDSYSALRMLTGVEPKPLHLGLRTALTSLRSLKRMGLVGGPPPVPSVEVRKDSGIKHTLHRDRQAVSHHYDVGNDFYRLVLGETMTYSCARFASPEETLDIAQRDKYDLVCRKLGLEPGMRLLDVGCGWGGLLMHAAKNHGVEAVGITLSAEQAALAKQRIAEAGLADKITVRVQDYRDLANDEFDAISSVGMFYMSASNGVPNTLASCTTFSVGGRLLNHAIDKVSVRRRCITTDLSRATSSPTASCKTSASLSKQCSTPGSKCATSSRYVSTTTGRFSTG